MTALLEPSAVFLSDAAETDVLVQSISSEFVEFYFDPNMTDIGVNSQGDLGDVDDLTVITLSRKFLETIVAESGEIITLKRSLRVNVIADAEGFHAENEELNVFGCGLDFDSAILDFGHSLLLTWDGLKDFADADLTLDAIQLRDKLAEYLSAK